MVTIGAIEITWGWLGLAGSERGLCGLTLPKPTEIEAIAAIGEDFPTGSLGEAPGLANVVDQLRRYFQGEPISFDVRLDLPDRPPFWRRVWSIVAEIPYGEVRSYGAVARIAGAPAAARAVGGAMANNPVPIIIPCHRVVGHNGSLTGFGGGLDMKRRLLELESARPSLATPGAALPPRSN
jgi:O-6-methylguanine DNA methyltransferase